MDSRLIAIILARFSLQTTHVLHTLYTLNTRVVCGETSTSLQTSRPIREPCVAAGWQLGACIEVHFQSPPFSQQDLLNCSIIKVSSNCIPFHVNFALHLAEFITLLRLYICLHCSCNLSLDFLCILISYKMLY